MKTLSVLCGKINYLSNKSKISDLIKLKAIELGFSAVGIAKAEKLQGFDIALNSWLSNNFHGEMSYMERNKEKRSDPTILVEGAKSVISLITSYYPQTVQSNTVPQLSKYAYGTDYHFVLKDKMNILWAYIKEYYPNLDGRIFVDSAPVSDKLWAVQAGLGWLGKNSCLINKEIGSFVFISELIVNVELEYDEPYHSNFCGSCTKCIDACPTNAIVQPGVIDSRKCISYLTIENKSDTIPQEFKGKLENRYFGCDTCQDVCPWNKTPLITSINEFKPTPEVLNLDFEAWDKMEKQEFNKLFKSSPLKRAKYSGIKRNVEFISSKKGQ